MSGRKPPQHFSLVEYAAADNLSFDSDSESNGRNYAAYFSVKKSKPALSFTLLLQCYQQLLLQFPSVTFEINALAYYYGLFFCDEHIAYDEKFNRLFCFFSPDELQLSRPEIISFRDDLRKFQTYS